MDKFKKNWPPEKLTFDRDHMQQSYSRKYVKVKHPNMEVYGDCHTVEADLYWPLEELHFNIGSVFQLPELLLS